MKKIVISFFLCFINSLVFADTITIDNLSNYPSTTSTDKMMVQWATTAEATQKINETIINDQILDANAMTALTQKGKSQLTLPTDARYFRIMVWIGKAQGPDFLTNWVAIIPGKTYELQQNQLVPKIMMTGSGC